MDDNTRNVLVALLGPFTGIVVGYVVAKIGLRDQRALEKDRWEREDAIRRRDRDLKALDDTYGQVRLELEVALALGLRDHEKSERFEAQREQNPFPSNDIGLLAEDSDEIYHGMLRLAGTDNLLDAVALRDNLRGLAWHRIQRQRNLVENGKEPERATRATWDEIRDELLGHVRRRPG